MIHLHGASVYNLTNAIRGMRNSWGSHDRSDSTLTSLDNYYRWNGEKWETATGEPITGVLGSKDLQLALQLRKAGPDHAKWSRFICVDLDLEALGDLWQQLDQYRVGADATTTSTSRMHTLGREPIGSDQFGFDNPDDPIVRAYIELLREARQAWIASGKRRPSPEWRLMDHLTAYAWRYRREVILNYQVLSNIYHARKHHRLDEWGTLCDWIEQMPWSELITLRGQGE